MRVALHFSIRVGQRIRPEEGDRTMISQGHTSRRHWIHCAFERVFGDPRQLASGGACATPLLHARPAPSVSRQAFSPCARIYFSTNTRRRSRGGTRLPSPCPPSPLPASSGTRHCRKCARVRACPSAWAHTLTERASSDAPSTPRTACNCHRCHWCATSREFPFWFFFFLFFIARSLEEFTHFSTHWLRTNQFVDQAHLDFQINVSLLSRWSVKAEETRNKSHCFTRSAIVK